MSIGLLITRPERTLLGVLAQVDHGAGEGAVGHAGHGDEELVREVDRLRRPCGHFIPTAAHCARDKQLPPWTARLPRWSGSAATCAPTTTRRCTTRCRRRARSGASSSSTATSSTALAARRPARRVHPRQRRALDAELRALARSTAAPACGLIVRHGLRRDEIAALASAAARAGGLRQPRRRAGGAGARRPGARRAGRRRHRAAHLARTTWSSSAARCSPAAARPTACSRPTRTPG